jgi:aryl-alcohol dehydrogenase-like predicted oxidoreductase
LAGRKTRPPLNFLWRGCWHGSPGSFPSPGTRNPDHLTENLGAINVQLTPAEHAELDAAFSKLSVRGGRMNEMQMKVVE